MRRAVSKENESKGAGQGRAGTGRARRQMAADTQDANASAKKFREAASANAIMHAGPLPEGWVQIGPVCDGRVGLAPGGRTAAKCAHDMPMHGTCARQTEREKDTWIASFATRSQPISASFPLHCPPKQAHYARNVRCLRQLQRGCGEELWTGELGVQGKVEVQRCQRAQLNPHLTPLC